MPNPCMVCLHPAHALIDWKLLDQHAIADIARHFRIDPADIEVHQAHHLDQALSQLADADEPDVQQALERVQSWLNQELYAGAQSYVRAMSGWSQITDATDWHRRYDEAQQARQSGQFLLSQLGAGRYLEPDMTAVLTQMRRDLLAEYQACGPAAVLLVDLAICSYFNSLQFQRWQGDLALQLERETFGQEGMEAILSEKYGTGIQGFKAEETLRRMRAQFTSLFAQTHRQLMHTVQALERLRRSVPPGRVQDECPVQIDLQPVRITTYLRSQTPCLTAPPLVSRRVEQPGEPDAGSGAPRPCCTTRMSWERRKGRDYYYRGIREGKRVRKVYLGGGPEAVEAAGRCRAPRPRAGRAHGAGRSGAA